MPERYSGVKMKFTIDGFSQKKAVELGLSAEDLAILRWFVDFQGSDKMIKFTLDDGIYAWVSYSYFLEDMPIIKCNRKNLSAKFQHLVDAGILKHKTIKQGGTFSAYCYGPTYKELISTTNESQESADRVPKTGHPIPESATPLGRKQDTPLPENDRTNIHLLNNPSTKDKKEEDGKPKIETADKFCGHEFSEPIQEKLTEWLTYKSERKEGYKPTGLKSFMTEVSNKLEKYTEEDVISLIGECMANNWKGICWEKLKGMEKPPEPIEKPIPQEILDAQKRREEGIKKIKAGEGSWRDAL